MSKDEKWVVDIRETPGYSGTELRLQRALKLQALSESMVSLESIFSTAILALDSHGALAGPVREVAGKIRETCRSSTLTIESFQATSEEVLVRCRHLERAFKDGNAILVGKWFDQLMKTAESMASEAEEVANEFQSELADIERILAEASKQRDISEKHQQALQSAAEEAKQARVQLEEVSDWSAEETAKVNRLADAFNYQMKVETDEQRARTGWLRKLFGFGLVDLPDSQLPQMRSERQSAAERQNQLEEEKLRLAEKKRVAEVQAALLGVGVHEEILEDDISALRVAISEINKSAEIMSSFKYFWRNMAKALARNNSQGVFLKPVLDALQAAGTSEDAVKAEFEKFRDMAVRYYQSWAALEAVCALYLANPQPTWRLHMPASSSEAKFLLAQAKEKLACGA